jgi:GDP-4-dehydro-6-deoxy-D-mannose reductase
MKSRRALVSGAGGFIGQAVTAALNAAGAEVAAVSRTLLSGVGASHALGPAPWKAEQWREVLETTRPDVIFHLAGVARGSDADIFDANVVSARGLFGALEQTGLDATIVLAGSATEYGASLRDGIPACEDSPTEPVSAYGRSKLQQTLDGLEFARASGRRVVSARIFNVIGPGMPVHLALGDFARQIARMPASEDVLVTGNLDVARDFVSAGQTAEALLKLAASEFSGVVNVCSGVPISLKALVDRMIAASGRAIHISVDPARLRPGELGVIIGSDALLAECGARPEAVDINMLISATLEHEIMLANTDSASRV